MSHPLPPLIEANQPVISEMEELRNYLDGLVPPKRDAARNVLIATWNLKEFGSLTTKWTAADNDNPRRDWRALWAITEIVSRFDIVALQEVEGDLQALRTMLKTLGDDWNFLITDKNVGHAGGGERLAFVFDARRVTLSGLACELVLPDEQLKAENIDPASLRKQFARTPYAVGFRTGGETIILVTLHVCYGEDLDYRQAELKAIADWMANWAKETTEFEQNLIVLGDFNIDRHDSPLYQAFVGTGLKVAPQLIDLPRSIFQNQADKRDKYYDQIAWFMDGNKRQLHLQCLKGNFVDFVKHLYKDIHLEPKAMQYRVSDHFPLWVEFACRSKEEVEAAQRERKRKHKTLREGLAPPPGRLADEITTVHARAEHHDKPAIPTR